MPYGFSKKQVRSSRGRLRQHTEKALQLLSDSMCKSYEVSLNDLKKMSCNLRKEMEESGCRKKVAKARKLWIEMKGFAEEAVNELRAHVKPEDVAPYLQSWATFTADAAILDQDLADYLVSLEEEVSSSDEDVASSSPAPEEKETKQQKPGGEVGREQPEVRQKNAAPPPVPTTKGEGVQETKVKLEASEPRTVEDLEKQAEEYRRDIQRLEEELERSFWSLREQGVKRADAGQKIYTSSPAVTNPVKTEPRESTHSLGEGGSSLEYSGQSEVNQAMVDTLMKIQQAMDERDRTAQLPRAEPEIFGGDPLRFPAWWNSYQFLIEEKARSDRDRLHYLCQYTTGVPGKIADGYRSSRSEDAYQDARDVIVDRYGNKLIVAQAFKDKLSTWSPIREGDGPALLKFSDFLWQCMAAIETIQFLTDLNTQEENLRLVKKLPKYLCRQWNRIVDNTMYEKGSTKGGPARLTGSYPTFQRFCVFVADEARRANSAVSKACPAETRETKKAQNLATGSAPLEKTTDPPKSVTRVPERKPDQKRTSGSSESGRQRDKYDKDRPRQPWCVYCKETHWVQCCEEYLKLPKDSKREFATAEGRCFGCLRKNHRFNTCSKKNPILMKCPEEALAAAARNMRTTVQDVDNYSMILPVWVYHGDNQEQRSLTYAMIDTQSDCSFITEDLANQLQVEKRPVDLDVTTLTDTRVVPSFRIDGLKVQGENYQKSLRIRRCYIKNDLPGSHASIPSPATIAKYPHLERLAKIMPEVRPEIPISMLIGSDCSKAVASDGRSIMSEDSEVFGFRSPLGWMVLGPHSENRGDSCPNRVLITALRERPVTMERFQAAFDTEFQEERGKHHKMSADDRKFMSIVTEGTIQRPDGHFEVPLPFRDDPKKLKLPDSRPNALRRLASHRKKMLRNRTYAEKFVEFMKKTIDVGRHAEPVPMPDTRDPRQAWYWCLHGVESESKPDVVRGVFDGSSKVDGVCINDFLLQGPDLANNLAGVLCRFRQELIPITCDVEGMFHQVYVPEWFRDYLRFFWYKDHDYEKGEIVEYRMCVHLFGATSSPGCANFALKETARRHGKKYSPGVAEFLEDKFYVDDGLDSQPDSKAAETLMKESNSLCREGGFNLHKYTCGDPGALKSMPPELIAKDLRDFNPDGKNEMPTGRVLGVTLSLEEDAFKYRLNLPEKKSTRRGCLSVLSSVYDPLGFVSPTLLEGRQILQELCKKGLDWDEKVDDELGSRWKAWLGELDDVETITIRRCYRKDTKLPLDEVEVHVFCDASNNAYGACGYILLTDKEGNIDTALLIGKSRVGPTKKTTIPRMELQAAVLGVKLANFLEEELRYESIVFYFWSDSLIVLGWILNTTKRFHVYVENRTNFIRTHSKMEQWRHIQTDHNPADIASRGCTPRELKESSIWWHGPPEIRNERKKKADPPTVTLPDDPEERKKLGIKQDKVEVLLTQLGVTTGATTLSGEVPLEIIIQGIELPEEAVETTCRATSHQEEPWILQYARKFSSWTRLIKIVACLIKMSRAAEELPLVRYYLKAEDVLIRESQKFYLKAVYEQLEGKPYASGGEEVKTRRKMLKPSSVYQLDRYMDDQKCLRVGGRVRRADLSYEIRHPILVPKQGHITWLLAKHWHETVNHMGGNTTLNHIRQNGIWILQGRRVVQSFVSACITCRKLRAPLTVQRMSDLPEERLKAVPAFTYAAVDVFGPFWVKVARTRQKRWICIFVCLGCKGIHMEVLHSLDTSSFLKALRRLLGRRGPLKALYCDRGTNFVGGRNELEAAEMKIDYDRVKSTLEKRGSEMIEFRFNAPKASHMGGLWERQIRTVRGALGYMLVQEGDRLDDEGLYTVVVDAEYVVNTRPLSYLDNSDPSSPTPLSPSQLMTLKPHTVKSFPGVFTPSDKYSKNRWRAVQYLSDVFWSRWAQEVLPEMQSRQKWPNKMKNLRIGDVVLVHDEAAPRVSWPMGRIVETMTGRDGNVRKVKVRTGTQSLERPVHKVVFLMEANEELATSDDQPTM